MAHGGKRHSFKGLLRGILEETLLSTEAGHTVYVLGGFGGAARLAAAALTGGRPDALTRSWQEQHSLTYRATLSFYDARRAAEPSLRLDEKSKYLNISDGGHIENLGVYELLRRRCKYIISIDGEQDPEMTFHALTTLQRLAEIDLRVKIDLNLTDLRLDNRGLSRSHFHFCRIRYPQESPDARPALGYLMYVKLSLTGNEGEFIRRYRLDEPAFPHQSTADQFFTEAQFEAYRNLGEHVGDKLFLKSITGELADSGDVEVERWFMNIAKSMLPD